MDNTLFAVNWLRTQALPPPLGLDLGVIIYLLREIRPSDTTGHFNGQTMLELSKTKTTHQLGTSFYLFLFTFFYFTISSVLDVLIALLLPSFNRCPIQNLEGR